MSQTRGRRARVKHPKAEARPLDGAERCPRCGVLQDWKDQYMTLGVGEDMVRLWKCHSCNHHFRSWRDGILKPGEWPEEMKAL